MDVKRIEKLMKKYEDKAEQYGHVTNISNTLENLQRTVGGYIETVTFRAPREDSPVFVVICDEEGRLKGKAPNCIVMEWDASKVAAFVGDIVIVGVDGDEFTDCPLDFKDWKSMVLLPEAL